MKARAKADKGISQAAGTDAFRSRTDALAELLGVSMSEIARLAAISPAMFFAYRSGARTPSRKAFGKLRGAEIRAKPDILSDPAPAIDPASDLSVEPSTELIQTQIAAAIAAVQHLGAEALRLAAASKARKKR